MQKRLAGDGLLLSSRNLCKAGDPLANFSAAIQPLGICFSQRATDLKRLPSIRSSLAKLVAACLLPALLVACVLLYFDYQRERADLETEAQARARAMLLTIDRDFAAGDRSLRALATSPYIEYWDMAGFHQQATEALKGHYINNIVLINAEGRQVLNTGQPYGRALPLATNLKQLERVIGQGQPDTSDLFVAPLPNTLAVNVAIPVRTNGKVTHSLVGTILPTHMQEILDSEKLPPDAK